MMEIRKVNVKKKATLLIIITIAFFVFGILLHSLRYQLIDLYLSKKYSEEIEQIKICLSLVQGDDDNKLREVAVENAYILRPDVLTALKNTMKGLDVDKLSVLYARQESFENDIYFFTDLYLDSDINRRISVNMLKDDFRWLINSMKVSESLLTAIGDQGGRP